MSTLVLTGAVEPATQHSPVSQYAVVLLVGMVIAIAMLWSALKATMSVVRQVAAPAFGIAKMLSATVVAAFVVGAIAVGGHGTGNGGNPAPDTAPSANLADQHQK